MVFIVGYLRETIESWIAKEYPDLRAHYVVQAVQDGTAGAVALAEPFVDDEVLIVFADAVLEVDYGLVKTLGPQFSGIIWAKEVEDYQRFGVIVTNPDGTMARIVEKPKEPISRLANIGLYHIRDHALLYEGIHHTLDSTPGASGEFYLTDAFQYMVDKGAKILTAPVRGWWDAGKPDTLFETNGHLLATGLGGVDSAATVERALVVPPVRFEAGVVVKGGRIGPNVTLEQGTRVEDCELRDTIVGPGAVLVNASLHDSLIGAEAVVRNFAGTLLVTDNSVVEGA
jgi:glucose-1-phosphate thymidylyltransferase